MGNKKEKKQSRKNIKKTGGMWPFDSKQETTEDTKIVADTTNKVSSGRTETEIINELKENPDNLICGITDGMVSRKPTKVDPKKIKEEMAKGAAPIIAEIDQEVASKPVQAPVQAPVQDPVPETVPETENKTKNDEIIKDTITPGGKRSSKKKSDKCKKEDKKNKTKKVKGGKKSKKQKGKK